MTNGLMNGLILYAMLALAVAFLALFIEILDRRASKPWKR